MRLPPRLLLAALQLATAAIDGAAQATRVNGLSMERFYHEGGGYLVAFNYRRTSLGRSGSGLDLGVGLVPAALPGRVVLVPLDVGLARSLPIGPVSVLLKGGAGNLVMFGARNAVYPGGQAGLALLIPFQRRSHLRVDISRRIYISSEGGTVRMWSAGLGISAPEKPKRE